MNITEELYRNAMDVKGAKALSINFTYNYEELVKNISEYAYLLAEYKIKGINRVGIIIDEQIKFDTISLIFALIQLDITPIIINERIGEQIKAVLSKEDIQIAFYETKPKCLKRYDLLIDKERKYYATINPYVNIKKRTRINSFNWALPYLISKTEKDNMTCKVYDKKDDMIKEEIITDKEIEMYAKNFESLNYKGKWEEVFTTLPLYKKEGFLYITRALANCAHVTCLNENNPNINLSKIINKQPSVITVDENMLFLFIKNFYSDKLDLSFLKKIALCMEKELYGTAYTALYRNGFEGKYFETAEEYQKRKKFE